MLRTLLDRLRNLRPLETLGGLLATINVAIVLIAVIGVAWAAVVVLAELAEEQAKARVTLGGVTVREDVRRIVEDTLNVARVLGDRPTLRRLLRSERPDAIAPFLNRFCGAAQIDGCAVVRDGEVVASSGLESGWDEVIAAGAEQGERFMLDIAAERAPVAGAMAAVLDRSERVYLVRYMDEALARSISSRLGFDVEFFRYRGFDTAAPGERQLLHSLALSDGRSATARLRTPEAFVSSLPLFTGTGEPILFIDVGLPAREVDAPLGELRRRLLVTAVVVALLALAAGWLLGRRIAEPLHDLTRDAARLAAGDFGASMSAGGTAEVSQLATTLEGMRRSLLDTMSDLRRSRHEAQAVLGGIVEGVFAVDEDRRIRYLNPRAERLLGITAGEALGRFCGDVLRPCDVNGERPCERACPILAARESGRGEALERLDRGSAGMRTTIIASAAPADGLQVQVIRDETELEMARRARDSVLANVSHEFRTPLAAQVASLELLRDGNHSMSPDERLALVESLERGALRLTRLVDNLLESVRIESGQVGLRGQNVVLREVVEQAGALVAPLLHLKRQLLVIDLPAALPAVTGDARRLEQVFVNLLGNANKFGPEDSSIHVGAASLDAHVEIWVEDEGPGIGTEDDRAIFERFARGGETEPEEGGLGLGLWIVKSIVERHGGSVRVERTDMERTRFTVELPVAGVGDET